MSVCLDLLTGLTASDVLSNDILHIQSVVAAADVLFSASLTVVSGYQIVMTFLEDSQPEAL